LTAYDAAPAAADEGDPIVLQMRSRLRELEAELELVKVREDLQRNESGRRGAWLRKIIVTSRGTGPALASQALNTSRWPEGVRAEPTTSNHNDEGEH
jgi:hypothetical protein